MVDPETWLLSLKECEERACVVNVMQKNKGQGESHEQNYTYKRQMNEQRMRRRGWTKCGEG